MIKPKVLKKGSCIGVIALSSPASLKEVELSRKKIEELGFRVKMGKSCYARRGYLSGCDALRASDINLMFQDKEVDAIFCLRGGYGAIRILDLIDYKAIKNNPKIFVGYSDITAIHIAINQKCKLITFHGPMVSSDMIPIFDDFAKKSLIKAITQTQPLGIMKNPEGKLIKRLVGGKTKGEIVGGNLSVIASTIGTSYEIDTRGKILFLEDIDEKPYNIDRMLMQLKLAGKLKDAKGFVLGNWKDCNADLGKESLLVEETFRELIAPLDKPTIYNLSAGHCKEMITLPLGARVRLDADKRELVYISSLDISK